MRYMGDYGLELANAMAPATKASLLVYAETMPDDRAKDLQDVCDATGYGSRTRFVRFGIGAVVGIVAGMILAKRVL